MSKVLTAAGISSWSGTCCTSDERWITLTGPKGAVQHVRLVGDAREQAKLHGITPQVMAAADLVSLNAELLAALRSTTESLEAWVEIADDEDQREYDHKALADARAVIRKAELLSSEDAK